MLRSTYAVRINGLKPEACMPHVQEPAGTKKYLDANGSGALLISLFSYGIAIKFQDESAIECKGLLATAWVCGCKFCLQSLRQGIVAP